MKNLKAVIYARYSSSSQREESNAAPINVCNAYAEKNGYMVIGSYADRAKTGTNDKRPELQRMIRDSKLDVTKESHRQMLIDTFVNAVFVHDDKLLLTFNFKDGTRTITLTDAKIAEEKNTGSNLDCLLAP